VARPLGPLKLHVISKTPGAFTTCFTRRLAGHDDGSLVSMKRSATVLNARAAVREGLPCPHPRPDVIRLVVHPLRATFCLSSAAPCPMTIAAAHGRAVLGALDLKGCVSGKDFEVAVRMKDRDRGPNGGGGD
jgi:hypothetical protein